MQNNPTNFPSFALADRCFLFIELCKKGDPLVVPLL